MNIADLVATLQLDASKFRFDEPKRALTEFKGSAEKSAQEMERDLSGAFKTMGLRSETAIDNARKKYVTAFTTIRDSGVVSSTDIQRAQGKLHDQLERLAQEGLPATGRSLREHLVAGGQAASASLGQAGVSTGILSQALGVLTSPLGLVAGGLAAATAAAGAGVKAFADNAEEVKHLMAVSGLSAEAADNLADGMKLLGVDTGQLTTGMFKMAQEIDNGGQTLARFGVSIFKTSGELKEPGELFLEIRDRISGIGSASQRNAALMDIFGRAGRSLAAVFAMSREELQKFMKIGADVSPWSDEHQRRALEYQSSIRLLSATWSGLLEGIGFRAVTWMSTMVGWFTTATRAAREYVDAAANAVARGPGGFAAGSGVNIGVSDTPGESGAVAEPQRLSVGTIMGPLALPAQQFQRGALGIDQYASALGRAMAQLRPMAATQLDAAQALAKLEKEAAELTVRMAPWAESIDHIDQGYKELVQLGVVELTERIANRTQLQAEAEAALVKELVEHEARMAALPLSDTTRAQQTLTQAWIDAGRRADDLTRAEHEMADGVALTKRQFDALRPTVAEAARASEKSVKTLDEETDQLRQVREADRLYAVSHARNAQERAASEGSFFAFVKGALREQAALWPTTWDSIRSFTVTTFQNVSRSLSDVFFNVFTGQVTSMQELWQGFMQSMLRAVSDFMAQTVVREFLNIGLRFLGFATGGIVGGTDIIPALLSPGETVLSAAASKALDIPGKGSILEALLNSDTANSVLQFFGLGSEIPPSVAAGTDIAMGGTGAGTGLIDSIKASLGFGTSGASIGLAEGALNTEFLNATVPGAGGLGIALSALGIGLNTFNAIQAFMSGNTGAGVGNIGGMIAGGIIGNLIVPGLGGILGGAALGGGVGGFLGGLFGGGDDTAHRKAKEKALQAHAVGDATSTLENIAARNYPIDEILNALSSWTFSVGVSWGAQGGQLSEIYQTMLDTLTDFTVGESRRTQRPFADVWRNLFFEQAAAGSAENRPIALEQGANLFGLGSPRLERVASDLGIAPSASDDFRSRELLLRAGNPVARAAIIRTLGEDLTAVEQFNENPAFLFGQFPAVRQVFDAEVRMRAVIAALGGSIAPWSFQVASEAFDRPITPIEALGQQRALAGFAEGGVVPGPIGAPQLAVVHGGEEYLGIDARGRQRTDRAASVTPIRVVIQLDAKTLFDGWVKSARGAAAAGARVVPEEIIYVKARG